MQMLNKTEQIAHLQGKDRLERQNAIEDMLTAYRSTPHPATGVTPFEAMRWATVRTKLDHIQAKVQRSEKDDIIDERDAVYKQKMKQNREGKNTGQGRLLLGDYVLVKQEKRNKWSMPYEPVFNIVHAWDKWTQNHSQTSYLLQSIVMPNFLYGLSVNGASSSNLNNAQQFLSRYYKRK